MNSYVDPKDWTSTENGSRTNITLVKSVSIVASSAKYSSDGSHRPPASASGLRFRRCDRAVVAEMSDYCCINVNFTGMSGIGDKWDATDAAGPFWRAVTDSPDWKSVNNGSSVKFG